MKRVRSLCSLLLPILALVATNGSLFADDRGIQPLPPMVTVNGSADVHVAPDKVTLTVGVELTDTDVRRLRKDLAERVRGIVTAYFTKGGIAERDIRTDYLSIQPEYDYPSKVDSLGKGVTRKYTARQNLSVTSKQVAQIDELVTLALENGANTIQGIDFQVEELRKVRDEARKKAVRAAREKATLLATELGQRIGPPISISEDGSSFSPWGFRNGFQNAMRMQAVGANAVVQGAESTDATAGAGSIPIGEIVVSAAVTVQFKMSE